MATFDSSDPRYGLTAGDVPPLYERFAAWDRAQAQLDEALGQDPPEDGTPPPRRRRNWRLWLWRGFVVWVISAIIAFWLLFFFAPVSQTEKPIAPPPLTLLAADGEPIAQSGAIIDDPVDVATLPPHVTQAFMAIEDRRFYDHWGVDPRGIARALWSNVSGEGGTQGGSTITQQLAKLTYLSADQTITRKLRELLIAFWLESWLTKDEIFSRYLSNAYFGDNVYGLRAASMHYFYRRPEKLTPTQAAMLAGLLKAPSRLAPTRNLDAARDRQRVVFAAMVDAGFITEAEADAMPRAVIDHRAADRLPRGTYFADWAMPQAREGVESGYETVEVQTTLDSRLQGIARRVIRNVPARAQVALVAMRPNGEVVAMIGGKDYAESAFNRATQARRPAGSTFKMIVYLTALKEGYTPNSLIQDEPITEGSYRPSNAGGRYRGQITLREAFARSSNVAAVRLYNAMGHEKVAETARELGITSPIPANASAALGSAGTTLLELTSAYAAVAADYGPVVPHALPDQDGGMIGRLFDGKGSLPSQAREDMMALLKATIDEGTGHGARLSIPAYGKTGTSQDSRDALFVGFAGDLVVGVWIGRDDNQPLGGINGSGLPATIWRDFMAAAVPGARPAAPPPARPDLPIDLPEEFPLPDGPILKVGPDGAVIEGNVGGFDVRLDDQGIDMAPDEETQQRIEETRQRLEELERQTEERRRSEGF